MLGRSQEFFYDCLCLWLLLIIISGITERIHPYILKTVTKWMMGDDQYHTKPPSFFFNYYRLVPCQYVLSIISPSSILKQWDKNVFVPFFFLASRCFPSRFVAIWKYRSIVFYPSVNNNYHPSYSVKLIFYYCFSNTRNKFFEK